MNRSIDNGESRGILQTRSGGAIPGTRNPAYALAMRDDCPIPVLIAVPHAGRNYPASVSGAMRDADYSKIRLEDRFADRIGERLAALTGAALLVAEAPRAMLDLNRSVDDVDWEMIADNPNPSVPHSAANRRARSGLGLVPRRLPGLGEIWNRRLSHADLQERIASIHAPYHRALSQSLGSIADRWGAALLLDLHSMPPLRPRNRDEIPAHFVLGDRFGATAHDRIVAGALQYFADHGAGVAHNRPYAGGYVLDRHGAPERGQHAIQLEICRSRYLDMDLREATAEIEQLVPLLAGLIRRMGEDVARLGRSSGLALAAE